MIPNHKTKHIFSDLLFVNGIYAGLMYGYHVQVFDWAFSLLFFLFLNVSWLVLAMSLNIYPWLGTQALSKELKGVWLTLIAQFALLSVVHYYFFSRYFSQALLIEATTILFVGFIVSRLVLRAYDRATIIPFDYIIVGGKRENLDLIIKQFDITYQNKATCIGRFGNTPHDIVENIGSYKDMMPYLTSNNHIKRLVYVYSDLNNNQVRDLMHLCAARFIDFMVVPREVDIFPRGVNVEFFHDLPLLMLKNEPLARYRNKLIKRIFDIAFAGLVLLLIFPWLLPIMAFLIKRESKGPIFFIQDRSGYFNKTFKCFKFRSMKLNNESDKKQATKDDNRITKIGAFMRKTNIDELPQFINVFLGQMSVVGPRPHMLSHTEEYSQAISEFMIRHRVKPGVTGWAQVNGHRGPTETVDKMRARVEHDIWYVENWSIFLDVKCVLLTILNGLKGEENAF